MSWSRHYAVISFPGVGHVRPVLPVVEELRRRGHRVTHVVASRLADTARVSGARLVTYESSFPEPFGRAESVDDAARMLAELLREGFAPLDAAERALAGDRPDLLLHDDIAPHTARLLGARWDVPVVRLYAHFADNVQSGRSGGGAGIDPAAVLAHPALREAWQDEIDRLATHGLDADTVMSTLLRDDAVAELVFVPREFHPDGDFSPRRVFVGSTADPARARDPWTPPGERRVVLVSLGTTSAAAPGFFRACAEAFADTDWHVVMTLGSRVTPEEVGTVPPNVELHRWLTHLSVLPHASVYVGAAGMGSLLEALSCATPVLALPQTDEQRGNADRIAELGLGAALDPADVTPDTLRRLVDTLAADPGTAARARRMSGHLASAGGATRAADVLEQCADPSGANGFLAPQRTGNRH
ncbi:glycosyltransferase [Actinokineospora auranticolor]|uniref:MGT family glycosyltransferase n=1 Tax=Actinokineospora auranticolor TaxID=155976 RepID=A0A2S6GTH2_9PSEU|nr:macrolide family glycosyltransferase [Actinokineospora auranticolor]PPK68510.1 MGT family glycosyltransferase [Actinokineospora auranticolor]